MRMNRLSRSSRPTGPKMRVPARLQLVVDEHRGVLVEADVAAVGTAVLLLRADDDAADDVALLHRSAGHGVFHRRDEDVTDRRVTATRAAEHLDAQHLFGAGVVGDAKARLLLDHRARSMTSTRRQRFSFESGRVSGDADPVADRGVVLLVVHVEALGALHRLGVAGVADALDDGDDGGLVHRVGDDDALADLAPVRSRASAALVDRQLRFSHHSSFVLRCGPATSAARRSISSR